MGREVGRRFKREGTYVCLWLSHADVWQKPTQYCKAIILQLKINKLKKKKRILKWVAISSSRGSSSPRDQTQNICTGRWFLYHWVTKEAPDVLFTLMLLSTIYVKRTVKSALLTPDYHILLVHILTWMSCRHLKFSKFKIKFRNFPGCPVVKIPCFQCRGCRFDPW